MLDYFVNWLLHIKWLLPIARRSPRVIAWLYSLIKPLAQLNDAVCSLDSVNFPDCSPVVSVSLVPLVDHIRIITAINGQTIQLERYLNRYYYSQYNPNAAIQTVGRFIYIVDNVSTFNYTFLWQKSENRPLSLYQRNNYLAPPPVPAIGTNLVPGPQYLYQADEFNPPYDFTVYVPSSLSASALELETLVNKFKQVGALIQILTY